MSSTTRLIPLRKAYVLPIVVGSFFGVLGFAVLQVWFVVFLGSCPICLVVYCFLCWLLLTLVFLLFQVSVRHCRSPPLAASWAQTMIIILGTYFFFKQSYCYCVWCRIFGGFSRVCIVTAL